MKQNKISASTVRDDFNDVVAVMHYTRAAHDLGLWNSERTLIERHFPDRAAPLLEAGCGAGRVTLGMWALGYRNLTAFDFAQELLDQARALAAARGADTGPHAIRFLHADATNLSSSNLIGYRLSPPPSGESNLIGYRDTERSSRDGNPIGYPSPRLPMGAGNPIGYPAATSDQGPAKRTAPGAQLESAGAGAPPEADGAEAQPSAALPGSPRSTRFPGAQLDAAFAGALFMFNGLMQIPGRENRRAALRGLHSVCAPGAPLLFTTHDRNHSSTERALWRLERVRWERGEQDPRLVEFGDRYFEETGVGRTFMHLPDRAEILADLNATGWTHVFDAMRRKVAPEAKPVRDFSDECRFWVATRNP